MTAPIDLTRLRHQTGNDRKLEREVLALFAEKSEADLARLLRADSDNARREVAHSLVGSARAVGATEVVLLAESVERGAVLNLERRIALERAVAEACRFIEGHLTA
jgi:HPt (histidine-containing phosphotransfer) domain-containing protein